MLRLIFQDISIQVTVFVMYIQSILIILISLNSTAYLEEKIWSLFSTSQCNNRYQNIVEKRKNCSYGVTSLFHNIFNISLTSGVKLHILSEMWLFSLFFPTFCKSDMSRYGYLQVFQKSLGLRDNKSQLYFSVYRYFLQDTCSYKRYRQQYISVISSYTGSYTYLLEK